jgi:putative ABC transport system permease protein
VSPGFAAPKLLAENADTERRLKTLRRKLLRDLRRTRGTALTIALVVAAGVAAFVTLRGTYLSITGTRDRYYAAQRFADVFSKLDRAPAVLIDRIAALPGVARAYGRVSGVARLPLASLREPAQVAIVSLPGERAPALNGVALTHGRMPNPDREDEALLLEHFASAHNLVPGCTLTLVVAGRKRAIHVVGIALSPEFVMAIPAGATTPAPERFAVLWMALPAVERIYNMRGTFNDVAVELTAQAQPKQVMSVLDATLAPYGGLGAYGRARQPSHYFLTSDLGQLGTMATMAPVIFLGIAAFLLNVVMSRLVELERSQIATLKALGLSNGDIAIHYLEFALVVTFGGALVGLALGAWLGRHMTALYTTFYRMPDLRFHTDGKLMMIAVLVSALAAAAGSAVSLRKVIRLAPAEAMRPPAPPQYRQSRLGRAVTGRLGTSARMIVREISLRPLRTVFSAVGIAAATGIIVFGQFFAEAMAHFTDVHMQTTNRETMAVRFVAPTPVDGVRALHALPGVRDVQWQTTLQVRVRSGQRERVVSLVAHPERHSLRPIVDGESRVRTIRDGEVVITDVLAKVLGVNPGDTVLIEPLQGDRSARALTVTDTTSELLALWVHMTEHDFVRFLGVEPLATEALLRIDDGRVDDVQARLLDVPHVATTTRKDLFVEEFRRQTGKTIGTFSLFLTLFAITIAGSVVYNNARVALSMRSRELSSLRVLGFTRGEISSVLLGELAVQVVLGVPLGLAFGRFLARAMTSAYDPEAFRFPMTISDHAYAVAACATVVAGAGSALLVRRRLDKLDLIEVLKTRE